MLNKFCDTKEVKNEVFISIERIRTDILGTELLRFTPLTSSQQKPLWKVAGKAFESAARTSRCVGAMVCGTGERRANKKWRQAKAIVFYVTFRCVRC